MLSSLKFPFGTFSPLAFQLQPSHFLQEGGAFQAQQFRGSFFVAAGDGEALLHQNGGRFSVWRQSKRARMSPLGSRTWHQHERATRMGVEVGFT